METHKKLVVVRWVFIYDWLTIGDGAGGRGASSQCSTAADVIWFTSYPPIYSQMGTKTTKPTKKAQDNDFDDDN